MTRELAAAVLLQIAGSTKPLPETNTLPPTTDSNLSNEEEFGDFVAPWLPAAGPPTFLSLPAPPPTPPPTPPEVISNCMPSPPLTHYPKSHLLTHNKHGRPGRHTFSGSHTRSKSPRPRSIDNSPIPPHLRHIISQDAFGRIIGPQANRIITTPPKSEYRALIALYAARSHSQPLNPCAAFPLSSLCKFSPVPLPIPGLDTFYIPIDLALHLIQTKCAQCMIYAFDFSEAFYKRAKTCRGHRLVTRYRHVWGGLNLQVEARRAKKEVREQEYSPNKRAMWCFLYTNEIWHGPLVEATIEKRVNRPRGGGVGVSKEYAEAFGRWDEGMKKTLPGYKESERRREWFVKRDVRVGVEGDVKKCADFVKRWKCGGCGCCAELR
jgi:hypothetical protein